MPELDTRSLLDSGDLGDEHTLLRPECEDPFDYVYPACVDVDRGGGDVVHVDADGVGFGTWARTARGVLIRVDFVSHHQSRRTRSDRAAGRRPSTTNETFVAFDHTARRKRTVRLCAENPALRQAAAAVLRAVRNDRLPLSVSSGWVLLPPSIAAALSCP